MRKILSIVAAMVLITAMLSSGALAQASKGQKEATGAGRGQEHGNRQNAPGHSQGDQDNDRDSAGDDKQKPSGMRDHKDEDWGNSKQDTDESESTGSEDADDESKDGDTGTTPDDKDKPAGDHERHEPKGRLKNIQAVTDAIGKLTDADTGAQLNALLAAYQNATDETSAKTALIALLDALAKAGVQADPDVSGGAQQDQQFASKNIEILREKVLMHAGHSNGTLLALLHAYENALRVKDHPEDLDDSDGDTNTDSDTDNDPADDQTGAGTQTDGGAGIDEAVEQLNAALDSVG